jgi:CheY-like chemotaxis protein
MPGKPCRGGNLYLETQNITLEGDYIRSFFVNPGNYVKVTVTDTGMGMDKGTQQRIFEPFFTTQEVGQGTGLGLASVYGIIKNHGGHINVYSEKGLGTTFTIYLPITEKKITEEKSLPGEILRGKEVVLLIDDEDPIIDVASKGLKMMGYEVLAARCGEEAVEIYRKNHDRIDLVILDMIMSGVSGGKTYDLLKEINPGVKVILSSGYSMDGEASQIMARGCMGFIQKPFGIKELSPKIGEIFDKNNSAGTTDGRL